MSLSEKGGIFLSILVMSLFGLAVGCNKSTVSQQGSPEITSEFQMKCRVIHGIFYLYRCENKEVICYRNSGDGGLFCQFKGGLR